jgi:hypothetical protein
VSYDKAKVDQHTLALLYLVLHKEDKYGARASEMMDTASLQRRCAANSTDRDGALSNS